MTAMDRIEIYTDGGGNTGPGAWAYVHVPLDDLSGLTVMCGYHHHTTNNRMELTAVIEAIESTPPGSDIHIISDSAYVINSANMYVKNWYRDGWIKGDGKPALNPDLWAYFYNIVYGDKAVRNIEFSHIKGHANNPMNEVVDSACTHVLHNIQKIKENIDVLGISTKMLQGTSKHPEFTLFIGEKDIK